MPQQNIFQVSILSKLSKQFDIDIRMRHNKSVLPQKVTSTNLERLQIWMTQNPDGKKLSAH